MVTKKLLDKVENIIAEEIKTFSKYLNGEVYGYIVKDKEGNVIDSCWGYYDDDYYKEDSYMVKEAKSFIDYQEKQNNPLFVYGGVL